MDLLNESTSARLLDSYRRLVASDLRSELFSAPRRPLPPKEIAYLLSQASLLALSAETDSPSAGTQCHVAYDIAIRLPQFVNGTGPVAIPLCETILSRLGNFPARALLQSRTTDVQKEIDPYIALESVVREQENRLEDTPENIVLTDFQIRLLSALRTHDTVSVSAPTSAGKSFTLQLEFLHRLRNSVVYTGIFLVPTRALIKQVSVDLMELFRENQVDCMVLSSIAIPKAADGSRPAKMIFVLTQERFATLLADAPDSFIVDSVTVDEAQEIGKARRGMTLERVVKLATRRYPNVQLFFSSPLRSNPDYLLSIFGRTADSENTATSFIEYQRPVTQNIILVKPVLGKPSSATLEILTEAGTTSLGTAELPFPFRGRYLANLAKFYTAREDVSIVYRNAPAEADKAATELSELCDDTRDDDLHDFADFIEQEIHRHYRLGSMIRKGVAFHYGNIPQIVRSRIEELAKNRKIKFVCCTSTLLQGVNLPAKNIFLENPKTGKGELGKISPGDFWNLVGRAGRLNHEFSGNVFCIFGKKWDGDPLSSERLMPMESAFQVAVHERAKELLGVATNPRQSTDSSEAWAEQAYANIYSDYVTVGQRATDLARDPDNRDILRRIDEVSDRTYSTRSLPDAIYANNMYVHPVRLEELADKFRGAAPNAISFMPIQPFATGAYDRLESIFYIIEQVFIREDNNRYKYFTFLAFRWTRGMSIRDLVKARLEFKHVKDEEKVVNEEIRDLFREIEEDLRYRYVKYTSIYIQVLDAVLRQQNLAERADAILPLHMFLEFGASQQTLISFMSLGLSRTSAILLQNAVRLDASMSLSDCKNYLDSINLQRIELPAICKTEIRRLRGKE